MKNQTYFLTLKVFAATGGIEKVCRVAGKALYEYAVTNNSKLKIFSMYDKQKDADENKYFPSEIFKGFSTAKITFIIHNILNARKCDRVILSHINLLLVGWLMKLVNPRIKLILFAHGIEVWGSLGLKKKLMLKKVDVVIAVSNYTASILNEKHKVDKNKCKVLNNSLDPFLPMGKEYIGNEELRKKYGYSNQDKILFTLSRLSSKERYKGYDHVIKAMGKVKEQFPDVKYLIAGSYDEKEKSFILDCTQKLELKDSLQLAGFIPDEDLVAHFRMADIYVMPSMKEGFGIVFIEAMYYGLPVIAGNKDGSVDALQNGELGLLIDPKNTEELENAIINILTNRKFYVPNKNILMSKFGYDAYKINFDKILNEV